MKSLKEYLYESSKEAVTVWDGSKEEELNTIFNKLDAYVKANKSLYMCSGWWPGTEVEGWNYTFDDLLKASYISKEDIGYIELKGNKLVLYPEHGREKDSVDVWLMKPEVAKWLDFKGAGEDVTFTARNQSGRSEKYGKMIFGVHQLEPFKSAPVNFQDIFRKSHSGFAKSIGTQSRTVSATEIKNILGI